MKRHFSFESQKNVRYHWNRERFFLHHKARDPNVQMIDCHVDGELAGNCIITRRSNLQMRHRAEIVTALYRKFWGLGIGSILLPQMEQAARTWSVSLLELGVADQNKRA